MRWERLLFSAESRRERRRHEIAAVHQAMASRAGVVGRLARLYDGLVRAEPRYEALQAESQMEYTRRRAMYIGGVAFTARVGSGVQVGVQLRRYTTVHRGSEPNYAEIGVFASDAEASRIRARLFTDHRGKWIPEGTASPGGAAYSSVKAPQLSYEEGFGRLLDDLMRLTGAVCQEAVPRELQ